MASGHHTPRLAAAFALGLALALAVTALTGCTSALRDRLSNVTGSPSEPGSTYRGDEAVTLMAPEVAAPGGAAAPEEGAGTWESQKTVLPSSAQPSTVSDDKRLIVRTKSMRMEVDKIPATVDRIRTLAGRFGGSITDMQISTESDGPVYRTEPQGGQPAGYDGSPLSGYVTVRVPVAKFDAFTREAAKIGKVLRQTENDTDVTQQHVDLSARLKNLESEEARLRDFFKAAKNVTEMLKIENELSRVRGEIESMRAQKEHLERQAAMSTVTLELVEPKPIVRPQGTDWGFGDALTQSVRAFVEVVNVIIVLLGGTLPLLIIALVILFLTRALIRRSRARRAHDAAASSAAQGAPVPAADTTETTGSGAPGAGADD